MSSPRAPPIEPPHWIADDGPGVRGASGGAAQAAPDADSLSDSSSVALAPAVEPPASTAQITDAADEVQLQRGMDALEPQGPASVQFALRLAVGALARREQRAAGARDVVWGIVTVYCCEWLAVDEPVRARGLAMCTEAPPQHVRAADELLRQRHPESAAAHALRGLLALRVRHKAEAAMAELLEGVRRGDGIAAFVAGLLFLRGDEVPMDELRGAVLVAEAAKRGVVDAQFAAAVCLSGEGIGVLPDRSLMLSWLWRAARSHHPRAQTVLGSYLLEDSRTKSNEKRGVGLLKAAIPYPPALHLLGVLYQRRGEMGKALGFFRRAAEQSYHRSIFKVAFFYRCGLGVPSNPSQAHKILAQLPAAVLGSMVARLEPQLPQCLLRLGPYYLSDDATEYADCRFAMLAGSAAARFQAGFCMLVGRGTDKTTGRGMQLVLEAAAEGDPGALKFLALPLSSGALGDPATQVEVLDQIRSAARTGSAPAQEMLARALANGRGSAQDRRSALRWMKEAATLGDSRAQRFLVHLLKHHRKRLRQGKPRQKV